MDKDREVLKIDMGAEGTRTVKASFPSNSQTSKVEDKKEEPKKVQKVITGKVIQKKKSLGKRFMETFIGEDIKNVKSYIFHDVLIPAAKDTITDIVEGITDTIQGSIEVSLFGETRRKGLTRGRRDRDRKSYVSYDRMSSRDRDRDRRADRHESSRASRGRHNFDDIILGTRGEAEAVRDHLVDLIVDYGEATVADLYDLVGITEEYTDRKYGWDNLSSSSISRVREGYVLNLPKPILLD